ncbi:MAG TPA: hypothetical protein PLH57_03950, partial [Oligoflexia bacterium]|nr:hypothetical protein [Oligoflexia bacterium]
KNPAAKARKAAPKKAAARKAAPKTTNLGSPLSGFAGGLGAGALGSAFGSSSSFGFGGGGRDYSAEE